MLKKIYSILISLTLLLALSPPANAYVGPGLGAGAIGVILGLLGSILLALFAFFWYPIKRVFKKMAEPKPKEATESTADPIRPDVDKPAQNRSIDKGEENTK